MNERVEQARTGKFDAFIGLNMVDLFLSRKCRSHDFTSQIQGRDFEFESSNQGRQGYLTGQDANVSSGDSILLMIDGAPQKYRVEEVDYYSSPCSMWMARLIKNCNRGR